VDFLLVVALQKQIQHFANSKPRYRMDPFGLDFSQRYENKQPVLHLRMGYFQVGQIRLPISVKKDVEIECPGSPSNRPDPPETFLQVEQKVKEIQWLKRGFAQDGTIDKPILS